MGFYASVNGEIVPADQARVSILDNGFVFGDSVYETLRTYGGRPFHLDRHLRRLRASASRIGIEIPLGDDALARGLDEVMAKGANPESYIRMIVSRGVGDISYHFDRVKGPTVVMAVKPYDPFPETCYREGILVSLVSIRRNHPWALDPAIKSCNLLNNVLAVREAQAKGALEAVLLNERGELAEGASSNLFIVRKDEALTPPLSAGILSGITREVILELGAAIDVPMREVTLWPSDLFEADEAFMTSTLKEAAPVRAVDERPIGNGRPGPVTLKILHAFREYAQRNCR